MAGSFNGGRGRGGSARQKQISQPLFPFLCIFLGTAHWRISSAAQWVTGAKHLHFDTVDESRTGVMCSLCQSAARLLLNLNVQFRKPVNSSIWPLISRQFE